MQTFRVVANQCVAATLVKVVFPQLFCMEPLCAERDSWFVEGRARARRQRVSFHVAMRAADIAPCRNSS